MGVMVPMQRIVLAWSPREHQPNYYYRLKKKLNTWYHITSIAIKLEHIFTKLPFTIQSIKDRVV